MYRYIAFLTDETENKFVLITEVFELTFHAITLAHYDLDTFDYLHNHMIL